MISVISSFRMNYVMKFLFISLPLIFLLYCELRWLYRVHE